MSVCVVSYEAARGGSDVRGPVGYLATHPTIGVTCAAAAFTTSLYACRRAVRPATKLKRAAWAALAALTAVEGAEVYAVLAHAWRPRRAEMGASS
jgi:hypothetical protein